MKKLLIALTATSLMTLTTYAHETEHHEKKSNFYVAVKALSILGSSVDEGTEKLEGDTGLGLGIDLGYNLDYGFSVEVDATYATNTVTFIAENGDREEFSASYITSSFDIDYKYHVTEELGLIAKIGYEYELETINSVDAHDTGFVYAGAVEYEISEHMALLGEYEVTTIEGPRGDSLFLGAVYSF